MKFSVITPTFRSSASLKLCIASVADQGPGVEHIVQDSCSDDGTLDWLPFDGRVLTHVEKDAGKYDAMNRGLRKSSGEILAFLSCNEQYQPHALSVVRDYFKKHPEVDVVFSDSLVLDFLGKILRYRKAQIPMRYHTMVSHLPTFMCSTFFRRKILMDGRFYFDPTWKELGDSDWVLRLLAANVSMGILREYSAALTEPLKGFNVKPHAWGEKKRLAASAPAWARFFRFALNTAERIRGTLGGIYFEKVFSYAFYTAESPKVRMHRTVYHPNFRWKGRFSTSPPVRVGPYLTF